MDRRISPDRVIDEYVAAVRTLFAPAGATTGERSASESSPHASLIGQAQQLAPLSHQLTLTVAPKLDDADSVVRTQAEVQLLAKVVTDLDVGALFLQAAADEELGIVRHAAAAGERSPGEWRLDAEREQRLALLLGTAIAHEPFIERGAAAPASIAEAKSALKVAIDDTLALVTDRVADSTATALTGLSTLGMAEVLTAAGSIGMGIAAAFGQAERLSCLYGIAQAFVARAYGSLLALLGPQAAAVAGEQVLGWLEEFRAGNHVAALIERLYATPQVSAELARLVDGGTVPLPGYLHMLDQIDVLEEAFHQQTALVAKILPMLKFVPLLPAVQQPVGLILLAGCYLVPAAYVVFTGADVLDIDRLQWVDRIEGMRETLEADLAANATTEVSCDKQDVS